MNSRLKPAKSCITTRASCLENGDRWEAEIARNLEIGRAVQMSDDNNPFDDMVNAAQKMAQALNPSLASLSSKEFEAIIPQMPKEMMELTFGNASNKDGLTAKSRLLLTLAGLTMQGAQAEAPLRLTVRTLH